MHGDLLNASWILELFSYVLCFTFFTMSLFCVMKMEELIFIFSVSVTYVRAEIYFYQGGDAASLAVAENYVKVGQF